MGHSQPWAGTAARSAPRRPCARESPGDVGGSSCTTRPGRVSVSQQALPGAVCVMAVGRQRDSRRYLGCDQIGRGKTWRRRRTRGPTCRLGSPHTAPADQERPAETGAVRTAAHLAARCRRNGPGRRRAARRRRRRWGTRAGRARAARRRGRRARRGPRDTRRCTPLSISHTSRKPSLSVEAGGVDPEPDVAAVVEELRRSGARRAQLLEAWPTPRPWCRRRPDSTTARRRRRRPRQPRPPGSATVAAALDRDDGGHRCGARRPPRRRPTPVSAAIRSHRSTGGSSSSGTGTSASIPMPAAEGAELGQLVRGTAAEFEGGSGVTVMPFQVGPEPHAARAACGSSRYRAAARAARRSRPG